MSDNILGQCLAVRHNNNRAYVITRVAVEAPLWLWHDPKVRKLCRVDSSAARAAMHCLHTRRAGDVVASEAMCGRLGAGFNLKLQ